MSPTSFGHSRRQGEIYYLLRTLLPGWVIATECGVETAEGVRVPDVAATKNRAPNWNDIYSLPVAPEICVEVLSGSNRPQELEEKRRLLGERGCREFWVCSKDGKIAFLDAGTGEALAGSAICPKFPFRLDLD